MAIIKYIIADDHKIFRQGLRLAISDDHRLKCIGEAANGLELLDLLESARPDVILLDLKMPEMDGLEAIPHIRKKNSTVKIIVITMYEDEHFIIRMMQQGVNGYLVKNAEPDEIKKAIHTVYAHQNYFNDHVSSVMLKSLQNKGGEPQPVFPPNFNERELQVLKYTCQELSAAEIAGLMHLSPRTVEGIRANLITKSGAKNIVGLVKYAVREGLV